MAADGEGSAAAVAEGGKGSTAVGLSGGGSAAVGAEGGKGSAAVGLCGGGSAAAVGEADGAGRAEGVVMGKALALAGEGRRPVEEAGFGSCLLLEGPASIGTGLQEGRQTAAGVLSAYALDSMTTGMLLEAGPPAT